VSPSEGDQRSWVRANGRSLTALELKIYGRAGLSGAEALDWANAGLAPYATESFRQAGHDLATATRAHALGLTSHDAVLAQVQNLTLEELAAHKTSGAPVKEIRRAAAIGIDAGRLTTLRLGGWSLRKVEEAVAVGASLDDVARWNECGLRPKGCLIELRAGTPLAELPERAEWHGAFPKVVERSCWQAVARSAAEAQRLKTVGFRPIDVLDGCIEAGPQATRRTKPEVVVNDEPPFLRRVDDMPVSKTVVDLVGEEQPDLDMLRAFGFKVRVDSRQGRFIRGATPGVAMELLTRLGVRRLLRTRPEVGEGTVLEELDSEGGVILLGSFDDVPGAVAASVALSGQEGESRLAHAQSDGSAPAEVLRILQPWAGVPSARPIRVNCLSSGPTQDLGGIWHFTPDCPEQWPGYRRYPRSVAESVGGFFFCRTPDRTTAFVGWFEEAAEGIALASASAPVAVVRRVFADGSMTTVSLERGGDGLVVVEDRGSRRSLGHSETDRAFESVDTLRRVRRGEITNIWVSPEAGCTRSDIASRLLIEEPDKLDDDPDLQWSDDLVDYREAEDAFEFCGNFGNRRLFINDERWLLCAVDGRRRPAVLRADPRFLDRERLAPEMAEVWGSFSAIEWGSMVSGTDVWTIGAAGDGVIIEVEDLNEEEPGASLRPGKRDRRLGEIARWLIRLRYEANCDVPMLAVENLIGQGGLSYGADFDDAASSSLECDLGLDVSAHEVAEFLQILSRVGGRPAVEAVRCPRSAAGSARSARLQARREED
jgi:hypothetical protein